MDKRTFFAQAARAYKMKKLRIRQRELGTDIMDEFAVRLNTQPTYEEEKHVKEMWGIFEELGARFGNV